MLERIEVSLWLERMYLEQYMVRMWVNNWMFLAASVILLVVFCFEMHLDDSFNTLKDFKQALIGSEANQIEFPDALYREAFSAGLTSMVSGSQTMYITEPKWFVSQPLLTECNSDILRVLYDKAAIPMGTSPMCGDGTYIRTSDQLYDNHLGIKMFVQGMDSVPAEEINELSIVYGSAIAYAPSVDILTAMMVRFDRSDLESPRLIVKSFKISKNSLLDPWKLIALVLLCLQMLLDLFYLVAPADFRPPRSVVGYCKSLSDSLRHPLDDLVNFSASTILVIYIAVDYFTHEKSAIGTVSPLSWFFGTSSLDLSTIKYTQLTQIQFTSNVFEWVANKSKIAVLQVAASFLAIARSILFMSSHPRLSVLVATLKRGVNEITASLTILLMVYLIFAFIGYFLFSDCLRLMSSFSQVLFTQLLMLMNQWPFQDLFSAENIVSVYIYIVSFGVCMNFIVLNTYLGVVLSAFNEAKYHIHTSKVERSVFRDAYLLIYETILISLHSWPSRRRIIEALELTRKPNLSFNEFVNIMKRSKGSLHLNGCSRCIAFYSKHFPEIRVELNRQVYQNEEDSRKQEDKTLETITEFRHTLQLLSESLSSGKT